MRYQKFNASAVLRHFIECYFIWECDAGERLETQSPPNGFGAMVFNYGDPYCAYQGNQEPMPVPMAFVSGQFTSNYHLVLKGKIGIAGIVFKPTSLHNFFDLRMSHLVNSRMPLALMNGIDASLLWGKVKNQYADEGRIDVLESFVLAWLQKRKSNLSVIDEAVEYMDQFKGCITVDEVAAYFKISRRYLEKKFLEKVGISPKFYARIKRFGALSNIVAHQKKIDWQEIVTVYGFHDQSHLIKEFLDFNQTNPTHYHQLHQEMTRYLKS